MNTFCPKGSPGRPTTRRGGDGHVLMPGQQSGPSGLSVCPTAERIRGRGSPVPLFRKSVHETLAPSLEKRPRQGLPSAGGERRRRAGGHSRCAVRGLPGRPCWCCLLGTRRQFPPSSDTFSAGGGTPGRELRVPRVPPHGPGSPPVCVCRDPTSRGHTGGGPPICPWQGLSPRCPGSSPARGAAGLGEEDGEASILTS